VLVILQLFKPRNQLSETNIGCTLTPLLHCILLLLLFIPNGSTGSKAQKDQHPIPEAWLAKNSSYLKKWDIIFHLFAYLYLHTYFDLFNVNLNLTSTYNSAIVTCGIAYKWYGSGNHIVLDTIWFPPLDTSIGLPGRLAPRHSLLAAERTMKILH